MHSAHFVPRTTAVVLQAPCVQLRRSRKYLDLGGILSVVRYTYDRSTTSTAHGVAPPDQRRMYV